MYIPVQTCRRCVAACKVDHGPTILHLAIDIHTYIHVMYDCNGYTSMVCRGEEPANMTRHMYHGMVWLNYVHVSLFFLEILFV